MNTKIPPKRRNKPAATRRGSSRRRNGRPPVGKSSFVSHVTPADGNIFADLGFPAEEAENLKVRAQLMSELQSVIADTTQVEAGRLLGVTQPRVSDLKRGKIGLFTVDALVNMLGHAGIRVRVSISRPRKSVA
jgi:predicted XRE-type DNA-binding protein